MTTHQNLNFIVTLQDPNDFSAVTLKDPNDFSAVGWGIFANRLIS